MTKVPYNRKHTEQMCPDVAGLGVNTENALEAGGGRPELGPVARLEVLVVLHPERQVVVADQLPPALPHPQDKLRVCNGKNE